MWKIRCSFKPKAQAVNKVQRQLRPKPYFPEFFKSRAQVTSSTWIWLFSVSLDDIEKKNKKNLSIFFLNLIKSVYNIIISLSQAKYRSPKIYSLSGFSSGGTWHVAPHPLEDWLLNNIICYVVKLFNVIHLTGKMFQNSKLRTILFNLQGVF